MPEGKGRLTAISSMATREVLADLAAICRSERGIDVAIESVAGVEAARRVRDGEALDVALLADDALASLEAAGHVVAGSRVAVAAAVAAVAVRADGRLPDVSTGEAVREAVLAASSIGYSTGPSGAQLLKLFERWGIADTVKPRLVQAPPGVPVGKLVASGEVAIGFQQLSELVHLAGIRVAKLPDAIAIRTVFSGGACAASTRHDAARAWLAFIAAGHEDVKRRHGMEPP